ncbi:UbiA family prenyltransferase, partial [Vibrio splendidus]
MVSRTSTQYEVVAQDAALTHKIAANNDTALSNEIAAKNKATWKVYLTLTKPKVVALMLLTALVGMCLAVPNGLPLQQTLFGMIGIGLMAGSAAAFNHLIDKKIDGQMTRTNRRPLPSGELSSVRVFSFAAGIGLLGFATLMVWVNQLTAWLTFASLLGYAVIYTMYLKRATPQNIVIAGIAGAMPPLLGWTAVTNELHS